ncbi:putative ubiquitin-conjugating enzyme E2 38 isoform X2 [Raphanus sativus]|uniref:Ubiquitin-conjugating enzyme E2 38 isoform X2 n=1 Tax=Raphanus sativus TaxID=3726 RepID=A0A9W3DR74_RAPSA|nr:putative ubiquitin-conjugating enzyme E2 38 isoform X2 [Raphanus sativus]
MERAVDRKAGTPEVVDVDKKNKGKSILNSVEVGMSTSHQPWWFPSLASKRTSKPNHHYFSVGYGNSLKQRSRTWVKKIQADWKILENGLPEMIYARACESRIDLMRAVIIGAEGTPYHDGLFFFDIYFPDTYPSVPPMVHYHSGGLSINPNLYSCGKVCLSLLGTWYGNTRENWLPQESTMLQLLVSIQALILNQKPYFNEPLMVWTKWTPLGQPFSKGYSENVFILSLRTMVNSMRRPPKHFEEFVRSHFFERAHDIVKAANAYIDGAPVGSIVKGTSESGSMKFRTDVAVFMKTVVDEFVKLGVKELQDKLKPPPVNQTNSSRLCFILSMLCLLGYFVVGR